MVGERKCCITTWNYVLEAIGPNITKNSVFIKSSYRYCLDSTQLSYFKYKFKSPNTQGAGFLGIDSHEVHNFPHI